MKQRAVRTGVLLSLVALTGAVVLAGCGGEVPQRGGKRIVILTNGSSPFWDAGAAGVNDAVRDLKLKEAGYTITFDRGDFTVETQLNKLKQYAGSTDVVAVGISVTDDNNQALVDELRALQKAGIKVITIDSDVDRDRARDARFGYVGTDNFVAGQELGKAAREIRPDGARYAAFVGLKGASNAKARIAGFADGAGGDFEQLEYIGDGGPDESPRFVRDAIDRNPGIDMLVGIWSYNTPAIVQVVEGLNLRARMAVVGFDADPPAINGMERGMVDALLVQNPYQMGYQGIKLLKGLIENDQSLIAEVLPRHGQTDGDIHTTGLKVIVPDRGSPLAQEMFDEGTEFLTLSAFKEWLKQFGLTGS